MNGDDDNVDINDDVDYDVDYDVDVVVVDDAILLTMML